MKLHSVVDTITNSSSVEFVISNPDGVLTEVEFKKMLAAALVDDTKERDHDAVRILLDFLPNNSSFRNKYPYGQWENNILKVYTLEDIKIAAIEWVKSDIDIKWLNTVAIIHINEPSLPKRINALVVSLSGEFV